MLGGLLSFVAALLLKRTEFNAQIRAKLLERQIAAHERILTLAEEMRVMIATGGRPAIAVPVYSTSLGRRVLHHR